jgi:hypothetical protein
MSLNNITQSPANPISANYELYSLIADLFMRFFPITQDKRDAQIPVLNGSMIYNSDLELPQMVVDNVWMDFLMGSPSPFPGPFYNTVTFNTAYTGIWAVDQPAVIECTQVGNRIFISGTKALAPSNTAGVITGVVIPDAFLPLATTDTSYYQIPIQVDNQLGSATWNPGYATLDSSGNLTIAVMSIYIGLGIPSNNNDTNPTNFGGAGLIEGIIGPWSIEYSYDLSEPLPAPDIGPTGPTGIMGIRGIIGPSGPSNSPTGPSNLIVGPTGFSAVSGTGTSFSASYQNSNGVLSADTIYCTLIGKTVTISGLQGIPIGISQGNPDENQDINNGTSGESVTLTVNIPTQFLPTQTQYAIDLSATTVFSTIGPYVPMFGSLQVNTDGTMNFWGGSLGTGWPFSGDHGGAIYPWSISYDI